jgi:hypothetical protein
MSIKKPFPPPLDELNLSLAPSALMTYHQAVFHADEKGATVVYLVDEHDVTSPLQKTPGGGHMYSAQPDAPLSEHLAMQLALGLDHFWSPDLTLIDLNTPAFEQCWRTLAIASPEFTHWLVESSETDVEPSEETIERRVDDVLLAAADYRNGKTLMRHRDVDCLDLDSSFSFTQEARLQRWETERCQGTIGELDAVELDHLSQATNRQSRWTVSCLITTTPLDTSKKSGLWVPDDMAKKTIEQRALIYAFGSVMRQTHLGGTSTYSALWSGTSPLRSQDFTTWKAAYKWLVEHVGDQVPDQGALAIGRQIAAREVAALSVNMHTQWCNGECYGITTAQLLKAPDGAWTELSSSTCYGLLGQENAERELIAAAQCFNAKSVGKTAA